MAEFLTLLAALVVLQALGRGLLTRFVLRHARRHVARTGFRPDLEAVEAPPGETLVVILHGTFCDGRTVHEWQEALVAAGYPVWVFEYRYLESIPANAARFDEALGTRLGALSDGVPGRVMLVGYSQGGMILRWLLSQPEAPSWRDRVVAWVQIASPNAGCEPADLAKFFTARRGEDAAPALMQLQRRSRLQEALAAREAPRDLGYGLIYGRGRGRAVLGRFFAGRPEGNAWSNLLGRIYEVAFLPPEENDGLVSTSSACALLPDLDPVLVAPVVEVETDHLGLLVHPRVAEALVDLAERFMPCP